MAKRGHLESGVALLTVLMLLALASAMLTGFSNSIITDQRLRSIDRTNTKSFYAAHGGLEQMTADLGNLFFVDFAPSIAELNAATATPPSIESVVFEGPDGLDGYAVTPLALDGNGNPAATVGTIDSGPFEGLRGLITPYNMRTVARTADTATAGSEVWLERRINTVALPVFQFGIFSETDLSFFAGPNFDFGGRVHSNGNLFLAEGGGGGGTRTLTLSDRVTAVGEVIRTHLSNGQAITTSGHIGRVRVLTAPGTYRDLQTSEGSLVNTLGSSENEPTWTNTSIGTYNGNIRNGRTGARTLTLPFVSFGATPVDLIKRGVAGEVTQIQDQRYYSLASLRILLSDTSADLSGLPGVTVTAPVPLDGSTVLVDPLAMAGPEAYYRSAQDTPLHGGFIKIEMQTAVGWQDVTMEILNFGFTGRNQDSAGCADPSPNAVIRIQRVRNNPANGAPCGIGSPSPYDYWPLTLHDTREGNFRDDQAQTGSTIFLGGVMHYIELDVNNLRRWLTGALVGSGINALSVNGYTVYLSDRRNNRNALSAETGEYGFEDFVNPATAAGTPNGALDVGEDVNGDGLLQTYGQFPSANGAANTSLPGAQAPLTNTARPWTNVGAAGSDVAQANRAILFRRALKLTNGQLGNIVAPGLTLASENSVYIQGNWNANAAGFGDPHVATAVIADAVTFLSNSWNDVSSFTSPQNPAGRRASTTWYRLAVLSGKGPAFPRPSAGGPPQDFGTDGGVHNFLRYVERWSGRTLNFRGAIASFYFNRQGMGTYKCCRNVYGPPARAFEFDVEFLNPNLLPPQTPMFRDINTTGFRQVIR